MGIIETAGIFFINNDNCLLVGHPTNHDFWSIPKGKLENTETSFEAAIRETWEESNVSIPLNCIKYELDTIKYKHGRKKLKPFVIFEKENTNVKSEEFKLKCNSYVELDAKWNAGLPEMDDFKWVSIEEAKTILHYTQVKCLNKIIEIIEKKEWQNVEVKDQ